MPRWLVRGRTHRKGPAIGAALLNEATIYTEAALDSEFGTQGKILVETVSGHGPSTIRVDFEVQGDVRQEQSLDI